MTETTFTYIICALLAKTKDCTTSTDDCKSNAADPQTDWVTVQIMRYSQENTNSWLNALWRTRRLRHFHWRHETEGKATRGLEQSHEWEINSGARLIFFSWRRLGNVRPQRACKTFWCYRSEILCARGNTAIRSGEHKWFIETSSKS